jgi:hypothetical protein
MAGAQDAVLSLADPKRAYILPEALLWITGGRDLPMLSDRDASRVFDVKTRTPLSAKVTMAPQVLYRKGRVVVMVTNAHPASPEYFMNLVVKMLDRVPESDPPSEPPPESYTAGRRKDCLSRSSPLFGPVRPAPLLAGVGPGLLGPTLRAIPTESSTREAGVGKTCSALTEGSTSRSQTTD